MLDEILDLFDRKREPRRGRSSGLRGMLERAFSGDDDRRFPEDRHGHRDDRRYRDDDDDDFDRHHGPNSRRRNDAFDFD
jgi:hypothetical protein